ncbi:MAG: TolC family protein [Ignavibacteriales bacterium]|nr:TolC family protein [Ignavibacteriales bacterium]
MDDTLYNVGTMDSLELCILRLDIKKAEEKVNETSFWRRLIPQVHLSASLGMHDLMFIDPTSFTPYILPRDAYRLTLSISLNEVFLSPTHVQAIIDLERLKAALSLRTIQNIHVRRLLEQQLAALQEQSESLEKELSIVEELLQFNELRFQQGRIEYDALARTKLELLSLQRSIQRIHQQHSELQLKLSSQPTPSFLRGAGGSNAQ